MDKQVFHIDFASTNEELDEALKRELIENGSAYYGLGNRKRNLLSYISHLSRVVKNGNYDIIHVNANSATAAIELKIAQKNGVPIRIVHNHNSTCDHKILHRICAPFFRTSYTEAIACSKKAGEWIFGRDKFRLLNNGIHVDKYRFSQTYRDEIRSKYGIDDAATVIGHLGKLCKQKNHQFLVDVFFSYHNVHRNSVLLLVGDGVLRGEIEKKVRQLGISDYVIFAGMQTNPERYLSAMDCFVFPSLWEGMPLSVIEAQASGIACLISGSIDEGVVVTDMVKRLDVEQGTGIWVDALQEIKQLDRDRCSDVCIEKIREAGFDAYTNAKELESIYSMTEAKK